jgi:hypothetical protein
MNSDRLRLPRLQSGLQNRVAWSDDRTVPSAPFSGDPTPREQYLIRPATVVSTGPGRTSAAGSSRRLLMFLP